MLRYDIMTSLGRVAYDDPGHGGRIGHKHPVTPEIADNQKEVEQLGVNNQPAGAEVSPDVGGSKWIPKFDFARGNMNSEMKEPCLALVQKEYGP